MSALLAVMPAAYAADAPGPEEAAPATAEEGALKEIVITAQKRDENLQTVPVSVEVLDNQKLQDLNIVNLDDYVKYSPSISYVRGQGEGGNAEPGTSHIYIRGVVSGGDGNHSGSQPSVGVYLDEQPVTTIDGTVDVHIYDVARIEVLEGPQGTLYGASSESGTVRIITNKPDPTKFAAGYDLEGNDVAHGDGGWQAQGFVNIPLTSWAAVRLVAWDEHDGGYISNVAGSSAVGCISNGVRTFPNWSGQDVGFNPGYNPTGPATLYPCPTPGVVGAGAISNAPWTRNDYNPVDTRGGRAAVKFDVGDNWTVMPTVMGQSVTTEGFFAYDPSVGNLEVAHFGPENSSDSWVQTALTVEGKFYNFDLVYTAAYMKRNTASIADYADYSEFYDRAYGSGADWIGSNGQPIMPQEFVYSKGAFEKWSHEIRLTTPQDYPVKGTIGGFVERQLHDIWEQYTMPGYGFTDPYGFSPNPNGFAQSLSIPTLYNTIWLTDEQRVDRDWALFAQATWDITSQLSATAGIRQYWYKNGLDGFYGFSANYDALSGFSTGMAQCFGPPTTPGAPCTDLNKVVRSQGSVPRFNITYKFTPDILVYATDSKGFRPGGVNRTAQANIGPYAPDFLKNYEIGWKTTWFHHRLRWNGALFREDWNNFQFSFLGPNSLTIIENGGNARIKGLESDIEFAATDRLMISSSFTFLDPRLTQNYCGVAGVTSCPNQVTYDPLLSGGDFIGPQAPAGTNLPVTPKFKANVVARYSFTPLGNWGPFAQASLVYQTQTSPVLRVDEARVIGMMPAYALADFAAGATYNDLTLQLFVSNAFDRRAQLSRFVATNPELDPEPYIVPEQPRTIGIRFAQRF